MVQPTGVQEKCQNCGALTAWDAAAGSLRCPTCGATQALPQQAIAAHPQQGDVVEYDLIEALSRSKGTWRPPPGTKQVKCNECGAEVEFPDGVTATKCSFCDSPSVLAQEVRTDMIAPESLVPFAVSRDQSASAFRTWLHGLWFRPSDLKHKADISELKGVYIPYWTFDASVRSNWSADAGYYYYTTESYTTTENGRTVTKTRQVRHIRWEPCSGTRNDAFDDHLVCASKGLPDGLAQGVCNFNTSALVAYAPQYLQGFLAEAYAIDLKAGWGRAQSDMANIQLARCAKDVPGDTQRNLRANHHFSSTTFKHVLLPIWVAAFRYNEKVFRFLVNGQTGKVAGKAPYSWVKILLFVTVLVGLAVGAYLLWRSRNPG